MANVTVHVAKTNLSKLIEQACAGEDVVIMRGRDPVVRLVPVKRKGERRFGSMRGQIALDDAFFDPLPDDEVALWNGQGA